MEDWYSNRAALRQRRSREVSVFEAPCYGERVLPSEILRFSP